jgi:hypothetical protein
LNNEEQPEISAPNQEQKISDETLSDLSGKSNFEFTENKLPWARLISKAECWNNAEIVPYKWTYGRSTTPELVNSESYPKLKKIISKEHFIIERKIEDGFEMTYLTDLSKRGTYINKKIIGLGNSYPILDGEYIGITAPATERSYKFELVDKNKNDSTTTESLSESDFESGNNKENLFEGPIKDSSGIQNPSKAEEEQNIDFSPRITRSKSNKNTKTDNNLKSTRSTSSKRTQPEHLSPNHLNKKAKNKGFS